MEQDNIIDYGSITIPTSWNDITLSKYQDIERYYADKDDAHFNLLDVLDIIIDKDRDFIMSLPTEFLDIILNKLQFLYTPLDDSNPSNTIAIDDVEYTVNTQNKLKTGEYIAVDTVLKGDKHNYAAILAILCRKKGEPYDSRFENEELEDRIKLFESQSITKIMPLIAFFLSCYLTSQQLTLLSLKVQEAASLTQQNIETSHANGAISKQRMKSLMARLQRLTDSIRSI